MNGCEVDCTISSTTATTTTSTTTLLLLLLLLLLLPLPTPFTTITSYTLVQHLMLQTLNLILRGRGKKNPNIVFPFGGFAQNGNIGPPPRA